MNDWEATPPVESSRDREFQWWQLRPPERLPYRRMAVLGLGGLVLLAVLGYGIYLWHYSRTHVSTDDAFITGHIAPVSARITGVVIAVPVNDNQDVKAGDVLVRLDPRDYQVSLAQARAAVEAARGELQNATANVPLTDDTTRSQVNEAAASLAAAMSGQEIAEHDLEQRRSELRSRQSAVSGADASVRAAQADFDRARLDRDRIAELFRTKLVARQDFDHADAAAKNAEAMLEVARHKLAQARDDAAQSAAGVQAQTSAVAQARQRVVQARAALANASGQRQQVSLRQATVDAARGRLQLAEANFEQAQLNLDYTTIRAPLSGRVTRKTVEVGQVLQAGQPLLALVDLDDVWVIANYKETELTHVQPGQRVTVSVDTYPGVTFKGRVDSIQSGSGAVFSLLPPENATGNYVKIVQRIPVKIVLDPGENARHLLVPGMSVIPTVTLP
jgi:membrane fusion protein (multidrug efflux system)